MLNVICTCVHIFSQEPCRGIETEKLEAREAKPLPLKSCSYGGRIPSQVCDHSEPGLHPTISRKLLPWHIDLRCGLGPLHHVSGPACSHPVPCETVICESSEPTLHAVGAQGVSPKGSELGVPRGPKEKGAQYPFSLPGPQLQPLGWQNQRVEATALESATWGLAFGFESSRLCDPRQATSLLCALITEESDLHVRTRDRVSAVSGHFDYWSLGSSLLEKGMAVHSSILAWRPPWTEKPGGLQLVGSQRVGQDWVSNTHRKLPGGAETPVKTSRTWTACCLPLGQSVPSATGTGPRRKDPWRPGLLRLSRVSWVGRAIHSAQQRRNSDSERLGGLSEVLRKCSSLRILRIMVK